MSSVEPRRQSPLIQFYARIGNALNDQNAGVVLREMAFLTHVNLRGDPSDPGFISDTAASLGIELPLAPNTWSGDDDLRACWLGPDEWLLIANRGTDDWIERLRQVHSKRFVSLTEVSGGQTVLRLSGDKLLEVFAKGCTLDFHRRIFATGQCAQSTMGKAPAVYIKTDDAPVYEVVVRRSFSDYIGLWLEDAAHEFGLRIDR